MIELKGVSKRFGKTEAVRELTVTIQKGQVVGLLGQNGAGKTTTLNMMTGYFPPTTGTIRINGHDMLMESAVCKRMIGYMPEKPPLYDEMTVWDYLTFCCNLKEVARKAICTHVEDICGLCGLNDVRNRVIAHLSKGYRQRVGLAQALCGDPQILILDEPTVGLDPRQVVEIRGLIRELGKTHTIIFSSHILSEVQQLCDHVMIMHHGRLVQICETGAVGEGCGSFCLRAQIAKPEHEILRALRSVEGVRTVRAVHTDDPAISEVILDCTMPVDGTEMIQIRLFRLLCAMDAPLLLLQPQRDTLEEAFLRITSGEGEGQV